MNKFSRTARSVTFAAIVGLSMGISAPAAMAQESNTVEAQTANVPLASAASLIDANKEASLTIHKFGDPDQTFKPTGEAADAEQHKNPLDGAGFSIYKILKTADGKTDINMNTNAGLAAAAGVKAADYAKFIDAEGNVKAEGNGIIEKKGSEQKTQSGGITKFDIGTEHAPYLVVETTSPKVQNQDGSETTYTPANPFVAFVPMTKNNAGDNQGTEWNYDVHAVPKNYKKTPPKKSVVDQTDGKLSNAGDVIKYNIDTEVRKIEEGKRLKYYFIGDTLDSKNFDVTAVSTTITVKAGEKQLGEGTHYTLSRDKGTNAFRVNFTKAGLQELKSGTKVQVHVEAVKTSNEPIAPNEATEWEPGNPSSDQDTEGGDTPPENPEPGAGRKSNTVETRFGDLRFKKVGEDRTALEGAEFEIYQTKPGVKCEAVDVKTPDANAFKVQAWDGADNKVDTVFQSNNDGIVSASGLHVNDFANNAVVGSDEQTEYCLVETKAPKGKELLSKAVGFKLLASEEKKTIEVPVEVTEWTTAPDGAVTSVKKSETTTQIQTPVYKTVSVTVGANEGEVVNLNDTTPQLPLTGGAGVGILAAIGAAIVAAGAWFARRGSKS
nr:SpaH/EbpB family LPXTG-anchored major pilin [Corynebacterium lactis]